MKKPTVLCSTYIASRPVWVILAAAAVLTAYYRVLWPFFTVLLYLSYLLWSYCWTVFICRATIVSESAIRDCIFAGESFERELRFKNQQLFPLVRCGIDFFSPPALVCSADHQLTDKRTIEKYDPATQNSPVWNYYSFSYAWLEEKKEVVIRHSFTAPLRGLYYLPGPFFYTGDPSGLYRGCKQIGKQRVLAVYPRLKERSELRRLLAYRENNRENIFGMEDCYETLGIRDYQTTDSLRNINWYATARTGFLKANLYRRKDDTRCLVVLDLSSDDQPYYASNEPDYKRQEDPGLEEAISIVSSTALFFLDLGYQTAFLTNAPLLCWEEIKAPSPDNPGVRLRRLRNLTFLDFSVDDNQVHDILRTCSAIDSSGRARPNSQGSLWKKVLDVPADTLVYLFSYHNPPPDWKISSNQAEPEVAQDLAGFYSPQKLAEAAAHVIYHDLSREVKSG